MTGIGELFGRIFLKDEMTEGLLGVSQQIVTLGVQAETLGQKLSGMGGGMLAAGAAITALTAPLALAIQQSISMGVEAVESKNLIEVSFGDMLKSAEGWAEGVNKAVGSNEVALLRNAGVLFTMSTSMGLARNSAFEMSTGVTELAGDLASFYNLDNEVAFQKIKSGLVGEAEPLRALGILLDEVTLKRTAQEMGITRNIDKLGAEEKMYLRYQAILRQTGNAQGDLARTIDSPANAMRVMGERVDALKIQLGTALLPIFGSLLNMGSSLFPIMEGLVDRFTALPLPIQGVIAAIVSMGVALGPTIIAVGSFMMTWSAAAPVFGTVATMIGTATTAMLTNAGAATTNAAAMLGLSGAATTAGTAVKTASTLTAVSTGSFSGMSIAMGTTAASASSMGTAVVTSTAAVAAVEPVAVAAGTSLGVMGAAAAATLIASASLTDAIVDQGDKLNGYNDAVRTGVNEVSLLRGAWELTKDAGSAIGGMLVELGGWVVGLGEKTVGLVSQLEVVKLAMNLAKEAGDLLKSAWEGLAMTASWAGEAVFNLGQKLYAVTPAASQVNAQTRDLAEASKLAGKAITDWATAQKIIGDHNAKTKAALHDTSQAFWDQEMATDAAAQAAAQIAIDNAKATESLKAQTEAGKAAAEAARAHAKAIKDLADSMSGAKLKQELNLQVEAIKSLGGLGKLTKEAMADLIGTLNKAPTNAIPAYLMTLVNLLKQAKEAQMGLNFQVGSRLMGEGAIQKMPRLDISPQARADLLVNVPGTGAKPATEIDNIIKRTTNWNAVLDNVVNTMQALGIESDSTMGKILGSITTAAAGAQALGTAFKSIGSAQGMDWGNLAQGMMQTVTAFTQATSSRDALSRAFGGAMVGAQVGREIGQALPIPMGGAIGAGAGAIIGAFAGIFNSPAWAKVAETAGQILGQDISQELAEAIRETATDLEIDVKEASLLHLSEALEESGRSVRDARDEVMQLFQIDFPEGSEAAIQQLEELNSAWDEVRETSTGVGDAMTAQMLHAAIASGNLTDSMRDFIDTNQRLAAEGALKIAEAITKIDLSRLDTLAEDGSVVAWADDLGVNAAMFFASGFQQAIAQEGIGGALDAMGEQLAAMYAQLEAAGNTAAMKVLDPFMELERVLGDSNSEARGMLDLLSGMGQVMEANANLGFFSPEVMGAMGTQLQATNDALMNSGLSAQAAMQAILPDLAKTIEAARNAGVPLDEQTEEMKAAAEAMGFSFPVEPMQQMVDLMAVLVEGMGFTLPESVKTSSLALSDMNDTAAGGMEKILEGSEEVAAKTTQTWQVAAGELGVAVTSFSESAVADFTNMGEQAIQMGDWIGVSWGGNIGEIGMTTANQVEPTVMAFQEMQDGSLGALDKIAGGVQKINGALGAIPGKALEAKLALETMPDGIGGGGFPVPVETMPENTIYAATGAHFVAPQGPLPGGGTPMVVHPGEQVDVYPNGQRPGGGGNTNNFNVNVSGVTDPERAAQMAIDGVAALLARDANPISNAVDRRVSQNARRR